VDRFAVSKDQFVHFVEHREGELKRVFEELDEDHNGKIDEKEVRDGLHKMKLQPTEV
jgi:Ca2+-binding EF-hand superfamily protein